MSFTRHIMKPVLDGVFAVNKPTGMSSATAGDVIKHTLSKSNMFAPAMADFRSERDNYARRGQKLSRRMRKSTVKIGHGGTLDPEASGVLAFGVGDGTKSLGKFQTNSIKGYEAVLVFGVATDSFDMVGKVVGRKGWEGVTREAVEVKLDEFRGKIMQRPSVYSALNRGGVRMYEYAREGKEIPELEKREMFVSSLELVDWMDGGKHEWQWPTEEIENQRKDAFVKALRFDEIGGVEVVDGSDEDVERKVGQKSTRGELDRPSHKRFRPNTGGDLLPVDVSPPDAEAAAPPGAQVVEGHDGQATPASSEPEQIPDTTAIPAVPAQQPLTPCPAPAVRLSMMVSSGFYVRSLCHDLGIALGTLGIMVSLKRTRQACFELDKNVMDYESFQEGEDVWGPKLAEHLREWPARLAAFDDLDPGKKQDSEAS